MVQEAWVEDTIAAIATPIGEGGIGIVRVSGAAAIPIVEQAFHSPKGRSLATASNWSLSYGWILSATGEKLDEVVVSVMHSPHSYTREDVVEINCHSGLVPLQNILQRVLELGARLAEPGEFTKRAFLHGRLDLSQAEAVIDIIRAKTDKGHRLAMRQLQGDLSKAVKDMRHDLVGLLAAIEAGIDFPEEVGDMEAMEVVALCEGLEDKLRTLLATADSGRIIREGIDTAIIGRPNVGKSSLLNMLVRENRAIVTAIPGTTRDVIEEVVNIAGFPFVIRDTAGIRHTEDVIEKIGVERAKALMEGADLVLYVIDGSVPLQDEDIELLEQLAGRTAVLVLNKLDLGTVVCIDECKQLLPDTPVVRVSSTEKMGLKELEETVVSEVTKGQIDLSGEALIVTRTRHRQALKDALESLVAAKETSLSGLPMDLVAIDIKGAAESLGEITGDTLQSEIIDRIFADFCIGK